MRHAHIGKYKSRTPKGRIVYKQRPIHKHTAQPIIKHQRPVLPKCERTEEEIEEEMIKDVENKWGIKLGFFAKRNMIIDTNNILKSMDRWNRNPDKELKFMWHPKDNLFLLSTALNDHSSQLIMSKKAGETNRHFDEFVRGIYSPKLNTVFIRTYGTEDSIYTEQGKIDNFNKQYDFIEQLKNMGMEPETEIKMNASNDLMTGVLGGRW